MTEFSKQSLKTFFETGDVPFGQQYSDLIDSCVNLVDTTAQNVASPLVIAEVITPRVSAAVGTFSTSLTVSVSAGIALTSQSSGAVSSIVTLTSGPVAGAPSFWIPIRVNGTIRYFPVW